jgi:GT2 family glycosyltransferase
MRLVGGRIANALPRNVYSSASQSLSSYLYDYYQATGSEMTFFTTNNMCCRREDFLAVGGFDAGFRFASEDRDLSLRWADAGGALHYAADAVVEHAHDLGPASFWRQHASYGRGAHALHGAMRGRGDPRPKVEPVGFYAGMLLYPLRHRLHGALRQAVLIGLSQVAMVAGYAAARRDARRPPPPPDHEQA